MNIQIKALKTTTEFTSFDNPDTSLGTIYYTENYTENDLVKTFDFPVTMSYVMNASSKDFQIENLNYSFLSPDSQLSDITYQ